MNKYLEKIAGKTDKVLNSVINWGDRVVGYSASRARGRLTALRESTHLGDGVPKATLSAADNEAKILSTASRNTRIRTGLATAGILGGGYLGIHKYQQHRDNKIMQKIMENANQNSID